MSIEANVFAGLLATMVDPRTTDEDLSRIVKALDVDTLRETAVILAAIHSGCIEASAERMGLDLDQMQRRTQRLFHQSLIEAEEETP